MMEHEPSDGHSDLSQAAFPGRPGENGKAREAGCEQPQAPPTLPRWLSVDQIRKMQRVRRTVVLDAMLNGELPYEQRGRIRYARLSDVIAWEERRLRRDIEPIKGLVHPDLADFA